MNRHYVCNRKPLSESAFVFLPLGSVKPRGWLRRQLEIQRDGLTGRLPEFWDSLGPNSGWLGGTGESWERGPYYLDGLVPLAYLLEDISQIDRVHVWLDWMLKSQNELGHFGPPSLADWWPFGIALKVLTQYQEASGDARVIPLMERFFTYMRRELPVNHMHTWATVRWADTALSIIWLYNRTGDPALLDLARDIRLQAYDWAHHFNDFAHTTKQWDRWPMRTHVVNNAMGVKAPGVSWVLTGWGEQRDAAWRALEMLDKYHGTAVGIFTGDEHYAGKDPTQGTELCAVVEYMFSLENLMQILGDPAFGDRLETIAFNALPATFTEDMWQHQYDQQANQVLCTIAKRHWTNNGNDANIFGLEPNYGCCTANYHQGWPKLPANLWMATDGNGLAAVAYGPSEVKAKVGEHGREVRIETETGYPFDSELKMTLKLKEETAFPLHLRVPAWAEGAVVKVNGEDVPAVSGSFCVIDRTWRDDDVISISLPMKLTAERRFRGAVSLRRGPLVYSLPVGERWERVRGSEPCPDFQVFPTTDWNYGLLIDPEKPEAEFSAGDIGETIFGPGHAPVSLRVRGKKIPEWEMVDDQAGPVPEEPSSSEPEEDLTLIPYGCAKLRITEFPLLKR